MGFAVVGHKAGGTRVEKRRQEAEKHKKRSHGVEPFLRDQCIEADMVGADAAPGRLDFVAFRRGAGGLFCKHFRSRKSFAFFHHKRNRIGIHRFKLLVRGGEIGERHLRDCLY